MYINFSEITKVQPEFNKIQSSSKVFSQNQPGDVVKGEVLGVRGSEMTMRTENGALVRARLDTGGQPMPGDKLELLITEKTSAQVSMKLLSVNNTPTQSSPSQGEIALLRANIPANSTNIPIAEILVQNGQVPREELITNLGRILSAMPDISPQSAVFIAANHLPIDETLAKALQSLQYSSVTSNLQDLASSLNFLSDFSKLAIIQQGKLPSEILTSGFPEKLAVSSNPGATIAEFVDSLNLNDQAKAALKETLNSMYTSAKSTASADSNLIVQREPLAQTTQTVPKEAQPSTQTTQAQIPQLDTQAKPDQLTQTRPTLQTQAAQSPMQSNKAEVIISQATAQQPAQVETPQVLPRNPTQSAAQPEIQQNPAQSINQAEQGIPKEMLLQGDSKAVPQQASAQSQNVESQAKTGSQQSVIPENSQALSKSNVPLEARQAAEQTELQSKSTKVPQQTEIGLATAKNQAQQVPRSAEPANFRSQGEAQALQANVNASDEKGAKALDMKLLSETLKIVNKFFAPLGRDVEENAARIKQAITDQKQLAQSLKESVSQIGSTSSLVGKADQLASQARVLGNLENFYYFQVPYQAPNTPPRNADLFIFKRNKGADAVDATNCTILIGLDTEQIGRVETVIKTDKNKIAFKLRVENEALAGYVRQHSAELASLVAETGYIAQSIDVVLMEEPASIFNADSVVGVAIPTDKRLTIDISV